VVVDHFTPLHCIHAVMIGGRILTCVLDQGAEVVVMPKEVWRSLGVGLRADHTLNMESVNTTKDATLGVVENVPLDFGAGPMFFQVQVTECVNFEILLGRPFFKLTACKTFDLPNGDQDILLTDLNTHKELCLPTQQWVKRCGRCVSRLPCSQHAPKQRLEKETEEKDFYDSMICKLREETLIRLISPHLSTHFRPVKVRSCFTSPRHRTKFAKHAVGTHISMGA